jgi:hypothetical protein
MKQELVKRHPNYRHGSEENPEYQSWRHMIQRCNNPNDIGFKYYGGRGIKVCEKWRGSFESFLSDMGRKPDGATIERINNDGDYEPSNCRWVSNFDQQSNRRNNRKITFNGRTLTHSQWGRELGISRDLIGQRIRRDKLSPEKALTKIP